MTDGLDRLLRHHLQAAARGFEPGHPDGSVGMTLSARLRRRRQSRNAAAMTAVLATVMGIVLFVRLATPPAQTLAATGPRPQPSGVSVATPGSHGTVGSHDQSESACSPTCSRSIGDGSVGPSGLAGAIGSLTTTPGHSYPGEGTSVPTSAPPSGPTQPTPTSTVTYPTTTVSTSTPAPPTTVGPQTFVFTLQDSSRTVTVSVGDTVVLRLSGCTGTKWSTPTSSEPAVLESEAGSPTPVTDGLTASFLAASSGQSQLAASITVSPCAVPIAHFTLTVLVG